MKNLFILKKSVFPVVYLIYILSPCFSFLKSRYSASLLFQMWYTGSVWPPAFLPRRRVRAFEENQYLAVTPGPSLQSPVCPDAPAWRTERSRDGNAIRQRGECVQAFPWHRRLATHVNEATCWRNPEWIHTKRWKAQSSLGRVVVVLEHVRPFMAACALPACTGAQQHVELLLWVKSR